MAELLLVYVIAACALVSTQNIRLPPSIIQQGTLCMGGSLDDDDLCLYRSDGQVELLCTATAFPAPQYTWYKDGAEIPNFHPNIYPQQDGTLRIERANTLNQGYYQCRAENVYGAAFGRTYRLTKAILANYPPSTTTSEYTASPGEPLQVERLPLRSVPEGVITWTVAESRYDEDPEVVDFNERINIDEQGNLHFAYIEDTDAVEGKLYKCITHNPYLDFTVGGSYSKIIIRNPRPAPDSAPTGQYQMPTHQETNIALLGRDMTLRCLFAGKPAPDITWNKTDDVLPEGRYKYRSFNSTLVIYNIHESDAGQYSCVGTNSQGRAEQRFSINVEAAPVFRNTTETERPMDTNATEGENVTFNCRTYALPPASVQWFVNGDPVDGGNAPERMSVSPDGEYLTISTVCKDCLYGERATDLMVVQYNASNKHGYAFGNGYLNVLLRTAIDISPPEVVLLPTDATLELPCHAVSDDSTTVTYQWLFGGREAIIEPPVSQISPSNAFVINAVGLAPDMHFSYTGVYTCRATNGYSSASVATAVEAAPVFRNITQNARPVDANVTEGEDATCNCKTYALPTASVQWVVNGKPLNAGALPERMSVSPDGQSLTISKVCKDCQGERPTDLMVVQCNASNTHGYAFGDGYLNVLLRTMIDIAPPREAILKVNVTLEIPCHAISDVSTHVTYQWYFLGREAILKLPVTRISPDNAFIIEPTGLAIDEYQKYTGVYTCAATNGYSTASEDCLVTLAGNTSGARGSNAAFISTVILSTFVTVVYDLRY